MGWAKQNKPGPENYPLTPPEEPRPAPRGVFTMDMPFGKPVRKVPKIKGLPEPSEGPDPDYLAGGGTWHSL
jgi:hypothetical protein